MDRNLQCNSPGLLNIVTKSVIIDSRFRSNPRYSTKECNNNNSSSSFIATLPCSINNVIEMSVQQLELPKAWFAISESLGNNYFYFDISGVSKKVKIPDGNYIGKDLESEINLYSGATDASSIPLLKIGTAYTSTVRDPSAVTNSSFYYSDDHRGFDVSKVTLLFNRTDDGQLRLHPKARPCEPINLNQGLGWILGYRNGSYNISFDAVDISACHTCTEDDPKKDLRVKAEGLVDLNGPRYIYLAIDDFNHNRLNDTFVPLNNSLVNKNIIARYSVPNILSGTSKGDDDSLYIAGSNTANNSNLISFNRQYTGQVNINKLKIELLDEFGREINMNNMDYSFVLSFKGYNVK